MLGANLIRHAGRLIEGGVRRLGRTPRRPLVAALATAVGVLALGPRLGVLIAVVAPLIDGRIGRGRDHRSRWRRDPSDRTAT